MSTSAARPAARRMRRTCRRHRWMVGTCTTNGPREAQPSRVDGTPHAR